MPNTIDFTKMAQLTTLVNEMQSTSGFTKKKGLLIAVIKMENKIPGSVKKS